MSTQNKNCTYPNCNLPIHPPDDKLCLGHAPIDNKGVSAEEFERFITNEKLRHLDFNFEGFKFITPNIEARVIHDLFQSEVNFRNCEFHGKKVTNDIEYCLELDNLTFQQSVDFTGSKFTSGIHFQNIRCQTKCILDKIIVDGETFINGQNINHLTSCGAEYSGSFTIKMPNGMGKISIKDKTVFKEKFKIENLEFREDVEFDDVTFEKHMIICDSNFKKFGVFTNCKFKSTNFKGTSFTAIGTFNNSVFSGETHFNHTEFIRGARFCAVEFGECTHFEDTKFNNEVNWRKAKFHMVKFTNTQFINDCDFTEVNFYSGALFDKTEFHKTVNFSLANFLIDDDNDVIESNRVIFKHTIFNDKIEFRLNSIENDLIFENITLNEKAVFYLTETIFPGTGSIYFQNINFRPFTAYFENISHPQGGNLLSSVIVFRNCNLKDVYFTNNDMSVFSFYKSAFDNARFISSRWKHSSERLWLILSYQRRNIIFEDNFIVQNKRVNQENKTLNFNRYILKDLNSLEVANLYRRFKVSLDNTKDYEQAGWFYFNEFEMKRRACLEIPQSEKNKGGENSNKNKKSKSKFLLYSVYKLFAGYGEKPLWSFYWFLIFVLTFSIINLFSGIRIATKQIVNYDLSITSNGFSNFISFYWFKDFISSAVFTLYRIIPIGYLPIPKEQFAPIGLDGYFIAFLNTVVLILFITFIAVGLKRIFRRF